MDKIDFLLPWVDGSDTKWQKTKKQYSSSANSDSNDNSRFRDLQTLKYVLRSIEAHFPTYNKIYLITQGHYPEWLDIKHPKIQLIKHDDIYFDKSHLPVFSSTSIEMNLANIKSLSDKFVYLNDDMVFLRPISDNRFFVDDLPVDFLMHGFRSRNSNNPFAQSINNNIKCINSKFDLSKLNAKHLYHKSYPLSAKLNNFLMKHLHKRFFWLSHWHHPQPYLKSTIAEAYELFSDEMMNCSKNRFRDFSDLNQYLYRYLQLVKGEFVPFYHNDACIASIKSNKQLERKINIMKNNTNIKFACFNDNPGLSDDEFEEVKTTLEAYLKDIFPQKASFEI